MSRKSAPKRNNTKNNKRSADNSGVNDKLQDPERRDCETCIYKKGASEKTWKDTPIGEKANVAIAILTMISVCIVFFTLLEMQKERDAAYRPYIVMNPIQETAEWDKDGDLVWLKEKTRPIENSLDKDSDGNIIGHLKLPGKLLFYPYLIKYSAVNVGVATATELYFKWDVNNVRQLSDYLYSKDSKYKEFYTEGPKSDVIICNDNLFQLTKVQPEALMYMKPEMDAYELSFPAQYSILMGMIMKEYNRETDVLPTLYLNIQFKDIQNKAFNELIRIEITVNDRKENQDGSGKATYQYNPYLVEVSRISKNYMFGE